jgi:hypothetical protein
VVLNSVFTMLNLASNVLNLRIFDVTLKIIHSHSYLVLFISNSQGYPNQFFILLGMIHVLWFLCVTLKIRMSYVYFLFHSVSG